jgi:hypothetical protein
MNPYRSYYPADDGPMQDSDIGFTGVVARGDPRLMAPGTVRHAVNKSFNFGSAETRGGFHTLPWAEEAGVNFPINFTGPGDTMDFNIRCGFGTVYGAGVFDDPNGQEAGLLAVRRGVYLIRANNAPVFIPLPFGETITAPVRFVQTFEKVLMFRGPDKKPLEWNPVQDFQTGYAPFSPIGMTDARNTETDNDFGDGTDEIPNAWDATAFNNRLYVIDGRDEVVVSDILDYTRFSRVRGRWKINSGTASRLNKLHPFNQTTLIAFKGQQIYLIGNVFGDLSEVFVDVLSTEYGCIAPNSVVTVGREVYFLSEIGYFGITQALDNKLQAAEEPISAPIQPIIDRINWQMAQHAVAAYHDNRIFLAVPIDNSQRNNAVLVLNMLNKAWEGYWEAPYMNVQQFIRLDRSGKRRLFIVNDNGPDNPSTGALFLVDAGLEDNVYGEVRQIEDEMITRGYAANDQGQKDFLRLILDQDTWNPKFSIDAYTDGANEGRRIVTDVQRDRRKFMIFGRGAHNVTNVNDDHDDPWRQDYSVNLTTGQGIFMGSNGVNPNAHQRVQYPYQIGRRGEYCQLRICNTQGRVRIHSITIEARAGARSSQERK